MMDYNHKNPLIPKRQLFQESLVALKGDGNVRFSGQQSLLLKKLMSYYGEILHGGQLSGAVEFLAI